MRASLLPVALRYVDQVARSGSIQRAARELHVAASAIDRQILRLEEDLGVPLFERMPRGMRLTPSGDAMVTLARRWRDDERRAADTIRQLQGTHQGHLRLIAMDSHTTSFLPALVEELAREHPRITLEIEIGSTDSAIAALGASTADLACVFNLTPRRDVHVLWSSDLPFGCVVAANHPLARHATTSMQEACAYPIALQSRALHIRRYLESHHGWLFSDGQRRVETNSLQLVKMLAKGGGHVAFTSELDAAPELIDGSLRFLPVRDQSAEPQSVSVAIDAVKPLTSVTRVVADLMVAQVQRCLAAARAAAVAAAPAARGRAK
jgi:DNA-binding transcriptional LysR family regulator